MERLWKPSSVCFGSSTAPPCQSCSSSPAAASLGSQSHLPCPSKTLPLLSLLQAARKGGGKRGAAVGDSAHPIRGRVSGGKSHPLTADSCLTDACVLCCEVVPAPCVTVVPKRGKRRCHKGGSAAVLLLCALVLCCGGMHCCGPMICLPHLLCHCLLPSLPLALRVVPQHSRSRCISTWQQLSPGEHCRPCVFINTHNY
jgi:hypothetical protein